MTLKPMLSAGFHAMKPRALTEMVDDEYEEDEEEGVSYGEVMWTIWAFIVDSRSNNDVCERFAIPNNSCWTLRCYSVVVTLVGIVYFATVVGFVLEAISEFMASLGDDRRATMERGHIVILGFSQKVPLILAELVNALASEGGGTIVIVDEKGNALEHHVDVALENLKGGLRQSRVLLRRGEGDAEETLKRYAVQHARAVIVLSQEGLSAESADMKAVRTLLALKTLGE